jgi:hypothetical protein
LPGGPRSYDRFEDDDLRKLADLAAADLRDFIERNPGHAGLANRVLCVALCQGAALHYVDGKNGVKDFDVWTFFYCDGKSPQFPYRRQGVGKFEGVRFQNSTRRVDFLGRTLKVGKGADPVEAVQGYLATQRTRSAWHLSQKAVVILAPAKRRGQVIWPRTYER